MANTKIVATLGPASEDEEILTKLLQAGVDVVRFNFSHDLPPIQIKRLKKLRRISKKIGLYTGAMLDTKGPEIRTHSFLNGQVEILKGSNVKIITDSEITGDANSFSITYPGLFDDIEIGGLILVDDGYLQLTVVSKDSKTKEIMTVANNTHSIRNKRGINVPNTILKMPFISPKDYSDILVACENDFDYIAASFTRRAADIRAIKEILKDQKKENIQIIAKVESQEALDNLDEIIAESDGVMVARGDLGVEVPPEDLPSIQKEMIQKCQRVGKLVIVATQMLESMQENPRPTRAEVSDIANAVYDGTDATMLSGETAVGKYPVEAVTYMNRIQIKTESDLKYLSFIESAFNYSKNDINEILAFSAARSALRNEVKGIIAYGKDIGRTVSKYRPDVPVLTFVDSYYEGTSLSGYFGIFPVLSEEELRVNIKKLNLDKGDILILIKNNRLEAYKES